MSYRHLLLLSCLSLSATAHAEDQGAALPTGSLMYTTYFYTAGEAVIHGYADDTRVRLVSMADNKPIWEGAVSAGETTTVQTGAGVYGFLSDKKASILVGTPSSCTVVGFWLRDENGAHRADHFYGQLPSGGAGDTERMIVWAVDDTNLTINDLTAGKTLQNQIALQRGERLEFDRSALDTLRGHVLDFQASGDDIMVQVYQDEGYTVPAITGLGTGTEFWTYVGGITNGVNDLNLISYFGDVKAKVEDLDTGEVLWKGVVQGNGVHTLTMTDKRVRVTAQSNISVIVAPYVHYGAGYAEHHFGLGAEGHGIDTDFMLPTPGELWVFSYFKGNHIIVEDTRTGAEIWSGDLDAGSVQGIHPGHGFFRVRSTRGVSVMGGAQACGAEYSPAAGLFEADEALMAAIVEIRQERIENAAQNGLTLSNEQINAPLNASELQQATRRVQTVTGNVNFEADDIEERIDVMVTE
ncbi:MAG: hypothetical protein AAFV53_33245 [Myxococcota bacterium]